MWPGLLLLLLFLRQSRLASNSLCSWLLILLPQSLSAGFQVCATTSGLARIIFNKATGRQLRMVKTVLVNTEKTQVQSAFSN
jgi:hypothetical protein